MRGPLSAMMPDDALLAQAVDELFDDAAISSGTAVKLTDQVGVQGLLDIVTTVGFYSTLGFLLNTARTPLDHDIAAELAAAPLTG